MIVEFTRDFQVYRRGRRLTVRDNDGAIKMLIRRGIVVPVQEDTQPEQATASPQQRSGKRRGKHVERRAR